MMRSIDLALVSACASQTRMRGARRRGLGQNLEFHLVLGDFGDARLGLGAVAVEDGEEIADGLAHDLGAVVGLFGVEDDRVEGGGVVAFHFMGASLFEKVLRFFEERGFLGVGVFVAAVGEGLQVRALVEFSLVGTST